MLLHRLSGSRNYVNMADIKSPRRSKAPNARPRRPTEGDLRRAIELLFFAYRDFTGEADRVLARHGFGRAHHRVIYFVGRHPGMTVSQLLDLLRITKQSLARVLGQLVDEGFVRQGSDAGDRRRRLLTLTDKGRDLERRLTRCQSDLISAAIEAAGPDAVEGFEKILRGIVNPADRKRFETL